MTRQDAVLARNPLAAWWARRPAFLRAQVMGWSLFSIVDLTNRWVSYENFGISLGLTLIALPLLILVTTAMRAAYLKVGLDAAINLRALVWIAILSFAAAAFLVSCISVVRDYFGWPIPNWRPEQQVLAPLIYYFFTMMGWSLAFFWVRAEIGARSDRQRAALAQAEALRAELRELRLQLDPHFLFNALNGVAEEVQDDPATALVMVRELSDYLRLSLATHDQPVASVAAEAASLAAYLRIQEARFGDQLVATLDVAPDAAVRPIASYLLQPLVENAIKHGTRRHGLRIDIAIQTEGEGLRIRIGNTGTLSPSPKRPRRSGVGLANVRRRLALHYPERHYFTLHEAAPTGSTGPAARRVVAELILEGAPC
ncbi:sensor histidine kinase [Roseixanthobacter pseudopolyaromaticivorans]|uniref:sensor histidine kinase n=1 Tax=Xanthobacteraceae TaxID=335928 RepID=UPI003728240B